MDSPMAFTTFRNQVLAANKEKPILCTYYKPGLYHQARKYGCSICLFA